MAKPQSQWAEPPNLQPRVQAPGTVPRGAVFEVRTIITHPMETGLRVDEAHHLIPRDIINKLTCRYNDTIVFGMEMHEAMAANPYVSFFVRAADSGVLYFVWEEDGGRQFTLEKPLTVTA